MCNDILVLYPIVMQCASLHTYVQSCTVHHYCKASYTVKHGHALWLNTRIGCHAHCSVMHTVVSSDSQDDQLFATPATKYSNKILLRCM